MGSAADDGDMDARLQLFREELWRRQDSQARRLGTIETVAGVLTGGAALVSTVVSALPATVALRFALTFGLVAVFVGLLVFMPRKIDEINPRKMREALRTTKNSLTAQVWHTDHLIGQIESREKLIGYRFALVRTGLVSMALTVLCVVLSLATN